MGNKMLSPYLSATASRKILGFICLMNFLQPFVSKFNLNFLNLDHKKTNEFIHSPSRQALDLIISSMSNRINMWIKKLFFEKFCLIEHLKGIKRYLLYCQEDFVKTLINEFKTKTANHKSQAEGQILKNSLKNAIYYSLAKYDNSTVLNAIKIKILRQFQKKNGLHTFQIMYEVPLYLTPLFPRDIMQRYGQISKTLWKLKTINYCLIDGWIMFKPNSILFKNQKENLFFLHQEVHFHLNDLLKLYYITRIEMQYFISIFQDYIFVEVLESAWKTLMNNFNHAFNLNQIIDFHKHYLEYIHSKTMHHTETFLIMAKLDDILDMIIEFNMIIENTNHDLFTSFSELGTEKFLSQLKYKQTQIITINQKFRNSCKSLKTILNNHTSTDLNNLKNKIFIV